MMPPRTIELELPSSPAPGLPPAPTLLWNLHVGHDVAMAEALVRLSPPGVLPDRPSRWLVEVLHETWAKHALFAFSVDEADLGPFLAGEELVSCDAPIGRYRLTPARILGTAVERRQDFEVPTNGRVVACRACGAPMVFAGKQPLDLETVLRRPGAPGKYGPSWRAESHFAHCPQRDRFRRREEKGASAS